MFYRKLYLKTRMYIYSIRGLLNSITSGIIIAVLVFLFVNFVVFDRIILPQANNYELSKNYAKAISTYGIAYKYYKTFPWIEENRKNAIEIPYRMATCYLKNNQRPESIESMLEGLVSMQENYGIFSKENAYFVRKYLIEYYLDNNNSKLASMEFNNLMLIYKQIGYDNNEIADISRLSGDLYYQRKKIDIAIPFYEKAYNTISKEKNIDYEILYKIVTRIADYKVRNKKPNLAIDIYINFIDVLKNAGSKHNQLMALALINVSKLYDKQENTKEATKKYEEAVKIIKKLPRNSYMKQNLKTYLKTLKDYYEKTGEYAKARELELELTREKRFSF